MSSVMVAYKQKTSDRYRGETLGFDHDTHNRQMLSDVTRELLSCTAALTVVIAIFIFTTIIYLHTSSAPALRASVERRNQHTLRRDDVEKLPAGGEQNVSRSQTKDPYAFASPQGDMCFLRSKLTQPGMPTIHSIFADPVSHNVIVTGVRVFNTDWQGDEFVSEFETGERTACDPIVDDYRSFGFKSQYVFVVTCPLPSKLRGRSNFTLSLYRKVDGAFSSQYSYEHITVCQSGSSNRQRRMLTMCTMLKDSEEFIPDWIDFHRYVGVDHIYIYDNQVEELSKLREAIAAEIKSGFVTVIPWAHEPTPCKNYLEVQIAHENDCLWRTRHSTKWMVKIDVDEYVQPMDPTKPLITDYLKDPLYDRIGAIRLQNWFFGRPNISDALGGKSLIQRNNWRAEDPTEPNAAHDKNILRPINVHYFKIHAMKLGGQAVTVDPRTQLRLVHYRGDNPRARHFDLPAFNVRDTSMSDIMDKISRTKLEKHLD